MNLSMKNQLPDSVSAPASQGAWWDKEAHAHKRPFLLARNTALEAARLFFKERDFVEVETSILQRSPGNETHIHAFATELLGVDGAAKDRLYLPTSPEFDCKKLLAAGERKIFTLAKSFRNREEGPLHAPEFIMLEWYRAGSAPDGLIEDCAAFVRSMARAVNSKTLTYKKQSADPFAMPEVLTLADAFARYAQVDLNRLIDTQGYWKREALAYEAKQKNIRFADDDTASDIYTRILVEKIEPKLGAQGRLTFLTRYPMEEAALARPCPDDARFAERFELYACGVELANAFGELTDAGQQRARFNEAMDEKQRIYNESYPIDEDFLSALSHMPEASGIALGFERLLVLLLGAKKIQDVMWTV
jgi:lysyl-tRNA synthetase class 2